MKFVVTTICTIVVTIVLALVVFTPPKCDHEIERKDFSFQFQGSTASSVIHRYCVDCDKHLGYSNFEGTPNDSSYLEVVCEHSDSDEIIGGEYYTMTATVTRGDYDLNKTRISCEIQGENIRVGFSVEFREEFEDEIDLIQEGDEITFRGRYYETGCGFTDCELIVK